MNYQDSLAAQLADTNISHTGFDKDLFNPNADFNYDESNDNITSKQRLISPTEADIAQLRNLLDQRIRDGHGETMLEVGVEENGTPMYLSPIELQKALENVELVAKDLKAQFAIMYEKNQQALQCQSSASATENTVKSIVENNDNSARSAYVMIRKQPLSVDELLEIRVAVVGNVDAGKSTLLGVLTKGVLDDGRGKARVNLFRHKHEIESGRTSSIGMEILGYDAKSQPITTGPHARKQTWEDICAVAAKVISFIDLAGHEKYLKTTVFGMTGGSPDFCMLMVGANAGIIGMTKEHLGLALSLNIPVMVVITKIDMCPQNILENTIKQLTKILKSPGSRKIPMFIKTDEDVVVTAGNFVSERLCPIFQVSNVTGEGLELLRKFLNILPAHGKYDSSKPFEYMITDTFSVPFVGTVVSGIVMQGIVHAGDQLVIGPDEFGHFYPTTVKTIQRKRVNVPAASAGQSASFALKKVKRNAIRKGMVILSKTDTPPKAHKQFEAEILVLYHSTTIAEKYQAMVHCGSVRQTARIFGMDKTILRTGDRALVQFEFLQHPEYIKIGSKLIFREGRTKGIGKVVRLIS